MQSVTCPIDNKPCDPRCNQRFQDRSEGGCLMTMLMENSDTALIIGVDRADLTEEDEDP